MTYDQTTLVKIVTVPDVIVGYKTLFKIERDGIDKSFMNSTHFRHTIAYDLRPLD